jgi:hypothetical protein
MGSLRLPVAKPSSRQDPKPSHPPASSATTGAGRSEDETHPGFTPNVPTHAPLPVTPRANSEAASFELNPTVGYYQAGGRRDEEAWRAAPDEERIREGIRRIVAEDCDPDEVAHALNLAPSSVARWRDRFAAFVTSQDLVNQRDDWDEITTWTGEVIFPEELKLRFAENWDHLVEKMHATAADFRQDPLEVFLTQSTATGWLFHGGRLDRQVVLGSLTAALLLVVTLSWFIIRGGAKQTSEAAPAATVSTADLDKKEIGEALKIADAYIRANTWLNKIRFIRDPERLRGAMEKWYTDHDDHGQPDVEFSLSERDGEVVRFLATFASGAPPAFLALVKGRDGYKIDWETSSAYQNGQWESIAETRPKEPFVLRCIIERETYYNFSYADAEQWLCLKLSYPRGPVTFFGYVARRSPLGIELDSQLEFSDYAGVTLEVQFPEDPRSSNQVKIIRLLNHAWLPPSPEDKPAPGKGAPVKGAVATPDTPEKKPSLPKP